MPECDNYYANPEQETGFCLKDMRTTAIRLDERSIQCSWCKYKTEKEREKCEDFVEEKGMGSV